MDFTITEEQELLLESLREIMARDCTEDYMKYCNANKQYPTRFEKALADNGFNLLGIPEEYGGTPVDTTTMMLVAEEITKNGGPHFTFGQALSIADMLKFGSESQKKDTMDAIKAGRIAFVLGFTEPQAGSDSSSIQTTFRRKDGKVFINGHKTFMSNAARAPYMLCLARNADESDDVNKRHAFSMWWIPMNAPGVKIERIDKIGWHMLDTCEVYLENVELEEKDLVGVEGDGFMQAMINFEVERLYIAASLLGMAECAFEDAAKYANQRVQFGKPIGSRQLIQEKITYMKIKIENMRNMVYKCAWEIDHHQPVQISSALAKLYCAQSANEVIDDAMQIMGGIGYTTDCRISRLWVDARVHRIGGGTDEIMIHIAGRAILKQYQ
ncbi:acyl-CoA dehydrogenase [Sporolactobacillus sp. CQH2019]|uniref:acyl-CoA dehydrogenase n=1 Tax=Sporolactobacillus sp. CQH2019 TaxID=3023512 RepID=UPI002368EE03|nr:acyl-CoA dehydrogenase [Sporolactobacillus sp. CQH2019]MDD9146949.1 acyl-CoA dehydrogenase [Sporolactobacillus sp. CQH2019]